jgi:spermidine synthase
VHSFLKYGGLALLMGLSTTLSAASFNPLVDIPPQTLSRQQSPYQTVFVTERETLRCLEFERRGIQTRTIHSCYDTGQPDQVWLDYNHLAFGAFLAMPNPKRVLVIGLGGGTIPHVIHRAYPNVEIDSVEIDPVVATIAQTDFPYRTDDRNRVHINDGRYFVKKALSRGEHYDIIILDAFSKEISPSHMLTREFFTELRSLMGPNGVLIANTIRHEGRLYDHESVTYHAVFGDFVTFNTPSGNRMLMASSDPTRLNRLFLRQQLRQMPDHQAFGIDYNEILQHFSADKDWNSDARILTDDWAPVELLRLMPR